MNILVPKNYKNQSNKIVIRFCQYIIKDISDRGIANIRPAKYELKSELIQKLLTNYMNVDCARLMIRAFKSLVIIEKQNNYSIQIDPLAVVEGTRVHLSSVVKLFEYGDTGVQPIPNMRTLMNEYSRDLDDKFNEWYRRFEQ